MAKDKALSANPVQAYHKKAKKASINKSRAEKSKIRDSKLQHRRPDSLQRQIDELNQVESQGRLNNHDRNLLNSLQRDLTRINQLQAEGKVGPKIISENSIRKEQAEQKRKVKIPKDPKRSFYYDPIYNPYGVPPPGMEYKEKDLAEDEIESDVESTTSSVARIPMPEGDPPEFARMKPAYTPQNTQEQSRIMEAPGQPLKPAIEVAEKPEIRKPAQTSYSSEPVMRDLMQESALFVPKNLKRKNETPNVSKQIDPLDVEAQELIPIASSELAESKTKPSKRRLNIAPSV